VDTRKTGSRKNEEMEAGFVEALKNRSTSGTVAFLKFLTNANEENNRRRLIRILRQVYRCEE